MSSFTPLPDLQQSDIDGDTLRQLILDIGLYTEIQEIIPKHTAGYVATESGPIQLDEACQLLVTRAIRGLQIRYRHQGTHWWDTVMPQPGGLFRIVRIEHRPPFP